MNARILAIFVFVVWSALCWYWYVCNIKGVCRPSTPASDAGLVTQSLIDDPYSIPADSASDTKSLSGDIPEDQDINVVNIYKMDEATRIHFPYGSTSKEDNAAVDQYLSELAEYLTQTGHTVLIAGHTDMVAGKKFNLDLAYKRANSIRNILVSKGVSKSQIKCSTYGESKPLATNDTPQGRYQNRRVEISIK